MKSDIAQQEFRHKTLRLLIVWLELETGLEFTETSSFRMDGSGVHTTLPVRGEDLRMRNRPVGEAIVKMVNDKWSYDYKRSYLDCAGLHGKGANMHIHLQVHPNTKRREKS